MRRVRSMEEALDRAQAQADDTGWNFFAVRRKRGPGRRGPAYMVTPIRPTDSDAKEWVAIAARAVFPEVDDEHVVVARYTEAGGMVRTPLRGADLDRRVAALPLPTP